MGNLQDINKTFNEILGINWECPSFYCQLFDDLVQKLGQPVLSLERMRDLIIRAIIVKLDIYHKIIKDFIDNCARFKVFFNYLEKNTIKEAVFSNNLNEISALLSEKGLRTIDIRNLIRIKLLTKSEIIKSFQIEYQNDPKSNLIVESVFSHYIYSLFPEKELHIYNSHSNDYKSNFYDYLRTEFPVQYQRDHTISILKITNELYEKYNSYDDFLSSVCSFIKLQYERLQNYCYLGFIVEDIVKNESSIQWRLYSDIVLYAEKFIEEELKIGYFHPSKIQEQTLSYIPGLDVDACRFDICNSGFTYKDCFIIAGKGLSLQEKEDFCNYQILVLFQKNKRDETIVPCPRCRSFNVRGNSYPTIGVKSWECNNPLCPDKSKYNRGKRYSLAQIIKQEAISDEKNEIDRQTIEDWRLDVVSYKTDNQILSYLIKEYSFFGDRIYAYNFTDIPSIHEGRIIKKEPFEQKPNKDLLCFFDSCYFKRFVIDNKIDKQQINNISNYSRHCVYNADCLTVLASLEKDSVDGAVTSPPYYNAKEYSHWDNIYCYLYDMYNHARYLFNVLKPGGYFLYNIFDYFDNENNVVFSLMGKKRMILGAYIINLFRRIGFEITQNIVWYKGHIQGNRATNQGNYSPYYQLPLNCYEHIFCFRKPSTEVEPLRFPHIINVQPVIKIINGKNVLGHTAPFPLELPNLITSRISGVVIDPYSGSFTTARSAEKNGICSISIEQSKEYCKLGMSLLSKECDYPQLSLF